MKVQSYQAGKLGQVEIDAEPFGEKVLYRHLKDAVVMYQANQRQGNASTKTRSEVHGSGKKPWKQKHTGRARAGDKKSPIWRKGGIVFGPKPRDYRYDMPAQAKRVALRSALAGKIKDGELSIGVMPKLDAPSSKTARAMLADLGNPRRTMFVIAERNENLWMSLRNFPLVQVKLARDLSAFDVVAGGLIVVEQAAFDALVERVGIKTQATAGGVA